MRFVLEQTPAESTAYRFAKLDMKHFPEAQRVVRGNLSRDEIYYTNSTLFNVGASMDPIERVKREGLFHPLIEAGSLTHVWLGESRPSPESLANFVKKTFRMTQNDQIRVFTGTHHMRQLRPHKPGVERRVPLLSVGHG